MLRGINHITIAVTDLSRSIHFYQHQLGMTLKASWSGGAYLSVAGQWVCLSVDEARPSQDYTHIAFDIGSSDFGRFSDKLIAQGVKLWKTNKSEGDSLYLLDPDGHKLEIHVGDLASRLLKMHSLASGDVVFYD